MYKTETDATAFKTADEAVDTSDEDLMLAYQQGDAESFDILYRRHKDQMYRFVLRQCSSEATANELFQEIWVNLINARERYEVTAKFSTWLYKIARNHLVDYYRSNSKHEILDSSDMVEQLVIDEKTLEPIADVHYAELVGKLKQAIAELPVVQREAFLLKEEGGFSLQQIAEIMDVQRETVKSRLRYAINTLRHNLRELI